MHLAALCFRSVRVGALAFSLISVLQGVAQAQTLGSTQVQSGTQGQQGQSTTPGNAPPAANNGATGNGSVSLAQPMQAPTSTGYNGGHGLLPPEPVPRREGIQAGEFEQYVQGIAGPAVVRRLGADLMLPKSMDIQEASPLVPADYLLVPGDELALTIWGSADADLRLTVDRSGRIVIPRVGPVMVAGVPYADLPETISKRVARLFKNFELSVSMGQLRGIRVYVTGFVAQPGAYSLTSLSTLTAALIKAGGPTAAGSFRDIQLKRRGKTIAHFDLYDLLVSGNRSADLTLQPDDVVHVGPVGAQVGVIGSVNQPGVFELKAGDTIKQVLTMAGGMSSVADSSRLSIERLIERNGAKVHQVALPTAENEVLARGDVLRVFSAVEARLPIGRQNKRIVIDGEVARPGTYVLPSNSSIRDALHAAGGFTTGAFVYGTQFMRESVRMMQQENYERALRDLETDLTRNSSTQRTANADEAKAQEAKAAAASRLVDRLRNVQPNGRVVLQLNPNTPSLPDMALEDGDRLYIPAQPTSVGVFGSVFNSGNYLYAEQRSVNDYLQLAGGPTRGADKDSTFVIRANGSVVSVLQDSSWLKSGNLNDVVAFPGDTVFVPEELNKTTFVQNAKDWTQIIYQLGLGAAALNAVK